MTWKEHRGGPCPVPYRTPVRVRLRSGEETKSTIIAGGWPWEHRGVLADITHYEVASD